MSVYTIFLNQFTIYVGSLFLIIGVSGNLINAGVFYKNKLRNPTTFLLFLASCFNVVYISIGLLTRILSASLNVDIASNHFGWCKMRFYLLQLFALISISCICYATIDQYFVTSQSEKLRQLSFTRFASYFNLPIVWSIAPIITLVSFGILTYHNVSLLKNVRNRERAQQNLTSMILLYIIFIVIGTLPYAFFYTYIAITLNVVKSVDRQSLEIFLSNIVAVILYFSNSCSFLVYYAASTTFRRQVKQFLHLPTRTAPQKSIVSATSELETFTV